ncbi:potassium channel family protein [Halanaeroarchaeum sulfurireducens]|uniref:TrkA-N domain-containing protein n=1 Tax=Halanaeroarchaeum sulfurireducens TaxID=1604004 RepID=A0A0N9MH02_9EURY|nr:NAD(P)-binding protein [Halanaeroarchaeum sulfurireducens]ALG81448.1 TrkA-N domain-containing protein [Halanaeroarchaeum sulfurireducens]
MNPVQTLLQAFARRSLLRRLLRPILAFSVLILLGVGGYRVLGGIGDVEAFFWLIDPTSIELHFQTHHGPERLVKSFAIVLQTGLVVVGLWIGETVLSAAFGGRISEELNRMQMANSIEELDDHVVVCGYGTFGKTIANRLKEADRPLVVVEQGETQYERALDDGHLVVQGDARREEPLSRAGIERASTIIGAIDDTDTNVKVAVTASQIAPMIRVIVRAGDQMDEAVARRIGADEVVVPEVVSGDQVYEIL